MANELSITVNLTLSKGELDLAERETKRLTVNGTHAHTTVQDIGFAAHEAIVVPAELATLGYCWVKNLDATNYVEIGRDVAATFYPVIKLKATEVALVRFSNVALYAKANTGAVKLKYSLVED